MNNRSCNEPSPRGNAAHHAEICSRNNHELVGCWAVIDIISGFLSPISCSSRPPVRRSLHHPLALIRKFAESDRKVSPPSHFLPIGDGAGVAEELPRKLESVLGSQFYPLYPVVSTYCFATFLGQFHYLQNDVSDSQFCVPLQFRCLYANPSLLVCEGLRIRSL